jgi:integrase
MKFNELTHIEVKNAKPKAAEYRLYDGNNLYLHITTASTKIWRVRYTFDGKRKQVTIGKYPVIGLADARERTLEVQKLILDGIDPVKHRYQQKLDRQLNQENNFESIAREWHGNKKHSWTDVHGKNILGRLEKYIFPKLGNRPINEISSLELLHALREIEKDGKHELTHRMLQICSQIFNYAVLLQKVEHNVCPPLKGALKPVVTKNYAHLKETDLPEFISKLNLYDTDKYNGNSLTKWGFMLVMLTFVRTGEMRKAKWEEIDLEKKVWKIPLERMKMKSKHIVPLSDTAVEILKNIYPLTGDSYSGYIFPSFHSPRKCFSENTFLRVIEILGYKGITTTHGFRTVASTILNENGFRADLIEKQLAHEARNQVRATYNHAEYINERVDMMQWWADYLKTNGMKI